MSTRKVSVTLAASAIERARVVAGPRGLSSYVDAALQDRLERDERRRAFLDYLDEIEAEDPTSEPTRRRAFLRADVLRSSVDG